MYFMQEAGQPLRLQYAKGPYGPYAENLRHVLNAVEGYLVSGYADGGDSPVKQIELVPGAVDDAQAFLNALPRRGRGVSPNTRKAYDTDWRNFEEWCRARGIEAMPADPIGAVLAYLTAHASTLKVSTLQRRLVAIRECHRYAGFDLDTTSVQFRDVWKGIRREEGRARPVTKKSPLMTATLRRAVRALPGNLLGCRDRALLLVGFAAGLRRSERASLETRRGGIALAIARPAEMPAPLFRRGVYCPCT